MSRSPLVSVVINNYNYERFLREAIDSALRQTYEAVEVLVVDDGSRDTSRDVIRSYSDTIISVFKANGGQASAFNAGLAPSRGDIVCYLDADDYFEPDKVARVVELFQSHPEAGWVFHELQDVDEKRRPLSVDRPRATDCVAAVDFRPAMIAGDNLPYLPATTGLSFRRELLARILPMPEEFIISADSYLRLAAVCEGPGVLCPARLAAHRIHGSNLFESRPDNRLQTAQVDIRTAYHLSSRYPDSQRFSDRLFSHAFGQLAGLTRPSQALSFAEARLFLDQRLSAQRWFRNGLRILVNYVRALRRRAR